MPRQARKDAVAALQHFIIRGIEKRPIFEDDKDRNQFIQRFGDVFSEAKTPIYAWALMPNHLHLFVGKGGSPIKGRVKRKNTSACKK